MTSFQAVVVLKHCRDLRQVGILVTQDPYCVLTCCKLKLRSNTHTAGGRNPVWNQRFTFDSVPVDALLKLEVFDEKMLFRDKLIGQGKVWLSSLLRVFEADGRPMELRVPLHTPRGDPCGDCCLTLSFEGLGETKTPQPVPAVSQSIPQPEGPASPAVQHHRASVEVFRPIALEQQALPDLPAFARPDFIFPQHASTNCWEDYERGRLLGSGDVGRIYTARHKLSRKEVAVKVIPKCRLSSMEEIRDVKIEVDVMRHLAGHVVRLKQVYEDSDDVCLVMELMRDVALLDLMAKRGRYTERDAAAVARDIVSVVAKCHAESVVYRDIKPDDFLLTDDAQHAKLEAAGVGLSTFLKEGESFVENVGSLFFTAPEVLRRDYGKEADVWSCGIMLYRLLSGSIPFGASSSTEEEVMQSILEAPLDLESQPWGSISEPAKDCIRRMLRRDPKHRATADEILNHEWLREHGCASDNMIEAGVITRMEDSNQCNKLKQLTTHTVVSKLPLPEVLGCQDRHSDRTSGNMPRSDSRDIFCDVESRSSGRITLQEFREAVRLQGSNLSEDELEHIWKGVDFDGGGTILPEEFPAATITRSMSWNSPSQQDVSLNSPS